MHKFHLIDLLRMSKYTFAQKQAQKIENYKYTFNQSMLPIVGLLSFGNVCGALQKDCESLWETSSSNHASTAKLDIMPKNVNKLLVANRGEIALRVVRTAREMGIPTVAVYAEQDRHAQYVQMADDAYLLSGDTYKDTYLNEDLLIDILQRSGADAVHPGYGFLSEVASFAQKVLDAGATWVGPNPKALVDLGDKITARRVATFAKVPPVPAVPSRFPTCDCCSTSRTRTAIR